MLTLFTEKPLHKLESHYFSSRTRLSPMPYSTQLFSPAHAANQTTRTRYCCLDAYSNKDYILCATCPRREREQMLNDDWDEEPLVPVNQKPPTEITHNMSQDFEGPLWK